MPKHFNPNTENSLSEALNFCLDLQQALQAEGMDVAAMKLVLRSLHDRYQFTKGENCVLTFQDGTRAMPQPNDPLGHGWILLDE
jgi:hypothetical protein